MMGHKTTGNAAQDLTDYFDLMTRGLTQAEQYHLLVALDRFRNPHKYKEADDDE